LRGKMSSRLPDIGPKTAQVIWAELDRVARR
jgi:hypothetical protein